MIMIIAESSMLLALVEKLIGVLLVLHQLRVFLAAMASSMKDCLLGALLHVVCKVTHDTGNHRCSSDWFLRLKVDAIVR